MSMLCQPTVSGALEAGGAEALLYRDGPAAMFSLVDTKSLQNGDMILTYRPA